MPSRQELVAHGRTEDEVSAHIGADLVVYQTLPDLVSACSQVNPAIDQFDCSVFTGEYITGGVDAEYLAHVEQLRNDKAKAKAGSSAKHPIDGSSSMIDGADGCSGPMSGAESLIGLAPSLEGGRRSSDTKDQLGLSNSMQDLRMANAVVDQYPSVVIEEEEQKGPRA